MESREEVLAAENSRLLAEMSSMKKKIMHALKKQQAELQAKIQAAEQRAAAAEAAIVSSSPVSQSVGESSDNEVASSLRSDDTLPGYSNGEARHEQDLTAEVSRLRTELEAESQGRSKDQEEIIKERDQLQDDLKQLHRLLETECKQKLALEQRLERELEAKLEDEKRIEQLSKANQNMEAQLMAAAQQVSDAFAQIAGMHDKLEMVSKESHTVNLAYATLTKEHERICKELENANDDAIIKAHEMEEILASHKATQEGQEAAMSQLMQQLQVMEASLALQTQKDEEIQRDVGSTEGKEILLEQVQERNRIVEALQKELAELRKRDVFMNGESSPTLEDLKQQNEVLTAKLSTLEEVNGTLQRKIQEIVASGPQDLVEHSSGASSAFLDEIASLKEQLKESRDHARNLENELGALSEENANVTRKLEIDIKERDDKYTELDLKFSRLQKRAKQRIQEVQKEKDEIEAKLSSAQETEAQATSKQASLQNELERFRAQAGDAIRALDAERQNLRSANSKLKEEVDDLKRLLDAKDHSLAESRRLASEKDQAALSMHAEMKEAEERHAAAVSDLNEKNKKVVEGLQNQLAEATLETKKLAATISALQADLADKESKLVDVEAALTGELARLSATLESAKGETAQVNEEQKNERLQWRATVASLEMKIQQLESACQQTELASSEAKRHWGIELETQRQAVADAQREASLAKDEAARLSKEFTAYKVRAHALLQKKESEIHAAKDVDLAAAQEANLKDAQREAAAAAAERDRAVDALKQAATEYETQLAARNVAIIDAEQRIRELATKLESMKGLLAFEREEWQRHSQELDVSWREKYEELARKQAHPADESIKSEFSALHSDYERLKGDYDSFRDMANKMMEAKDQEIAKLLDDNDSLQKSVQSQSQVSSQLNNIQPALDQQESSISILAVAEQQILLLARQQAQREEELKQCQRQIQVLQEELSELEHENRLHSQQEAMLKEELRSMERAAKRNGVDMTYLKNVILKLLETGEAEALLPVVGMLLQFSPDEVRRCQEAYSAAAAADSAATTPRSLLSRLSFSSGK